MTRRSFGAFLPAIAGIGGGLSSAQGQTVQRKGRLKQAVTRGCFGKGMPFEDMCRHAARLGVKGFDLVGPAEFPMLKKYSLVPTMVPGGSSISDGINRTEFHDGIEKRMRAAIDVAVAAGAPNVIVLSGNRRGMPDGQAADNCVVFLNKIKPVAEDKGVTICMELLNSKVNHPDYQCDRTSWGVEVCKRVNSQRVKLLYDVYHMQIMEGDVIRIIRESINWIGHFHTAGNPGRHEFDDTQELNYRGICKAIVDLGFAGYLAHEYSPLKDPLKSLEEAISICDV